MTIEDFSKLAFAIPLHGPITAHSGGETGGHARLMFLDSHTPISCGREWPGAPKKLAAPTLKVARDTLAGTLDFGSSRVATGTMDNKHRAMPADKPDHARAEPASLQRLFRTSTVRRAFTSASGTIFVM